jgi:hypothetical protein
MTNGLQWAVPAVLRISSDDLIGICIKAASMAEHNSLWLPQVNLLYRRLRPSWLEEQRQAHAEDYLAVRMVHSGEPSGRSPWLGNLVQLEVDDCVGEYQRLRIPVEENELLEIATGKKELVDLLTPFFRRVRI